MNTSVFTMPGISRKILSFLPPKDVCNFEQVNTKFRKVVTTDNVWNEFVDKESPYFNKNLSAKANFIRSPLSRIGGVFFLYGAIEFLLKQYENEPNKQSSIENLKFFQEDVTNAQDDATDANSVFGFKRGLEYFGIPIVPAAIKPYLVLELCEYGLNDYDTITKLILLGRLMVDQVKPFTEQQKQLIERLYSNIDIKHIDIEKALILDDEKVDKLINFKKFINNELLTPPQLLDFDENQIEKINYAKDLIEEGKLSVHETLSLSIPQIINHA